MRSHTAACSFTQSRTALEFREDLYKATIVLNQEPTKKSEYMHKRQPKEFFSWDRTKQNKTNTKKPNLFWKHELFPGFYK